MRASPLHHGPVGRDEIHLDPMHLTQIAPARSTHETRSEPATLLKQYPATCPLAVPAATARRKAPDSPRQVLRHPDVGETATSRPEAVDAGHRPGLGILEWLPLAPLVSLPRLGCAGRRPWPCPSLRWPRVARRPWMVGPPLGAATDDAVSTSVGVSVRLVPAIDAAHRVHHREYPEADEEKDEAERDQPVGGAS